MLRRLGAASTVWLAVAAPAALPQEPTTQDPAAQDPAAQDPAEGPRAQQPFGHVQSRRDGDVVQIVVVGLRHDVEGFGVHADHAVIGLDATEGGVAVRRHLDEPDSGLPRRGTTLPPPRRALADDVLRERLEAFLRATGRESLPWPETLSDLGALRSLYLEGDVTLVRGGLEWLRAARLYYSAVDDRAVMHDVTLRFRAREDGPPMIVTVRAPRLVRQGGRIVGDDVSVTTDPSDAPHFAVHSGQVEILERGDHFELRTRSNRLRLFGRTVLPLPDQDWRTDEQHNLLIKGASAGYSSREGVRARVVLGSTFNRLGGAFHELVTGRTAAEFAGDWRLGLGFIEERGFPIDGELEYRAGDVWFGHTRGFFLDDSGENIREIRRDLSGRLIDESQRTLLWTENRIRFDPHTTLDVTAFDASDPAVLPEFHRADWLERERPESSLHLRHAVSNRILTATARADLAGFSYTSGRSLSERFVEEVPHVTFDWFSIPLAELPEEVPLLLTSSSGVGLFRSSFDDTLATSGDDDTLRVDQELELSAPFGVGPLAIRPFVTGRFTWYDETLAGDDESRWAFSAGVEAATRLERRWTFADEEAVRRLRHVVVPAVRVEHRFAVDGEPAELRQFDRVDALDEDATIRVGLLQMLSHRSTPHDGSPGSERDLVWLDLAQNVKPIAARDNAGDRLGLFEFELVTRPFTGTGLLSDLMLMTEGEFDWNLDELRTFNNALRFRTGDVTWLGEYRKDLTDDGQIGYGATLQLRRRWTLGGYGQYDLERDENITYSAGITRSDLNWRLRFMVSFNNVTDDTTFRVDFLPTFGGLFRERRAAPLLAPDFLLENDAVW